MKKTQITQIRIWQSYSCNNSSSYRLVARFSDPKVAEEVATELRAFLAEHAEQMDAMLADGNFDDPTEVATALGTKYGFKWTEPLMWSDDQQVGDEPTTVSEGGVFVLYHGYCNGFPPEITAYLQARGAKEIEGEDFRAPSISVLFRIPRTAESGEETKQGVALRNELTKLFDFSGIRDKREADNFTPPWSEYTQYGPASFFCDGETMGFYIPITPQDIKPLKAWLEDHGVDKPSIALCQYADLEKFDTIAKSKCTACEGSLKYLDPRVHGIATEQLSCAACGGMFELKSFPVPKITE